MAVTFAVRDRYRYTLTRSLGPGPLATFVMLNPSTAGAFNDDPTVRKCVAFCRRWGCGRLQVVNLFAYRATSPRQLKQVNDPVGPRNRRAITSALRRVKRDAAPGPIVCA